MPVVKSTAPVALMRHALINDDAVQAIVGARVRTSHVLDPDRAAEQEYPLVILDLDSGGANFSGALQSVFVYVYTFHRDSKDAALTLYDAVYAALQMKRLENDGESGRGYSREAQRPTTGWNDQAMAYFARARWRVTLTA